MCKECKECEHWKHSQRELNYDPTYGFCDQNQTFDFDDEKEKKWDGAEKYKLMAHNPWGNVQHEKLSTDGTLRPFDSELITHKAFGCIFFSKNKIAD